MAPVARQLASAWGVLEPLQTAVSLEGQVEELRATLEKHGELPITLMGFSWGAWLSFILAAHYPALVRKLILVGSGSFEEHYVANMLEIRLARLSEPEQAEAKGLLQTFNNPAAGDKKSAFARLGALLSRADAFDPIPSPEEVIDFQVDVYEKVWEEAAELRRSGELLAHADRIHCPVLAIHGDHDPHDPEGVRVPLSRRLKDFRFILLEHCGHKPWAERHAKKKFYELLKNFIRV
jgi:pimeloyl-ACP methyl ester carboxylesterase